MRRLINRIRRSLAKAVDAKPSLPTRKTHSAYPETQIFDDGSWMVRFYSYEPVGWIYQGHEYRELTDSFSEPELRHPTTYAEGTAPAENIEAWRQYYANRPQPVTLIETLTGQSKNRDAAAKDAYRAMRDRIDSYMRN